MRLDLFLAARLPSVTRAKIKRLIDENYVTLGGEPCKAGHIIRPGELVTVYFPIVKIDHIEPEDIQLDIIYEDESLLVVNKPPGLVVHPAYGNMSGTLVNALMAHCKNLSSVAGDKRPGLVHRLDKDTSGLLVVAKDDVTHVELSRQLSQRKIEREYRAIVWGHLKKKTGTIAASLARSPKDRTKMQINEDGKHAVTHYELVKKFHLMSYVKLYLETGRTHQIRVHMASIGHPVFSDKTYGGRGHQLAGRNHEDTILIKEFLKKYDRQMLHARSLVFVHPQRKELVRFDSPLPADMQMLIQDLETASV
ncbi:RluA family pseudouridine synthase [candidate division KSB1 bacterium]|nr:RluA family pseudouridine synthase [candidate division KSB1 bacterium]